MTQVGVKFGVTRERVRQVLKRAGITRRDGGAYVRSALRDADRTPKLIGLMDETGCGLGEAVRLCGFPTTTEAREYARSSRVERAVTRFWSRVDSSGGPEACHPWMGTRLPTGYGVVHGVIEQVTGSMYAHRSAFILSNERQPEAVTLHRGTACVLHSCDNPPCCNPRHLREGTMADNMKDRDTRGRARPWGNTPGQPWKSYGAKRTPEQCARMKRGQRRAAREGRGITAWWKSLSPEQRAAHKQKCADAVRAKIAADPTGHAEKIRAGRTQR